MFGLLVLLCDTLAVNTFPNSDAYFRIYGIDVYPNNVFLALRDLCCAAELLLPIVFLLGWCPQTDTLAHHILEQVHMHIFGGSGTCSLLSAAAACAWDIVIFVSCYALVAPGFNALQAHTRNGDLTGASTSNSHALPHASPRISGALGIALLWAYVSARVPSDMQSLSLCLWESTKLAEKPVQYVGIPNLQVIHVKMSAQAHSVCGMVRGIRMASMYAYM
jgi:hypothetical protein